MSGKRPLVEAMELWPGPVEDLAEAVGVRRNTLYVYASGRRTPPPSLLREVARLLEDKTSERAKQARNVAKRLREDAS